MSVCYLKVFVNKLFKFNLLHQCTLDDPAILHLFINPLTQYIQPCPLTSLIHMPWLVQLSSRHLWEKPKEVITCTCRSELQDRELESRNAQPKKCLNPKIYTNLSLSCNLTRNARVTPCQFIMGSILLWNKKTTFRRKFY